MDEDLSGVAGAVMATLNDRASEIVRRISAHAATDVTGFGLIGHLSEMTGALLGVELFLEEIPFIPEAVELLASGITSGALHRNKAFYGHKVEYRGHDPRKDLLFDPQTSGGLLFAINAGDRHALEQLALDAHQEVAVIGRFLERGESMMRIR